MDLVDNINIFLLEAPKEKSWKKADYPNRIPFYAGASDANSGKLKNLIKNGYILFARYDDERKAKSYISGFKKMNIDIEVIKRKVDGKFEYEVYKRG
jgi:hypothetical protein